MCFRSNKARVFFCNVLIIITIIIWEISTEEEDEIVVEVDEVAMTEDAQLCTEQLVLIAAIVVRFLSDQVETNLFIAVVVSKEMMTSVAMTVDEIVVEVDETVVEADETVVEVDEVAMTEDAQLCTEQLVLIVVMVVRFLSDQVETNLFIAVVVLKKEMIQVQENLRNLTRATTI